MRQPSELPPQLRQRPFSTAEARAAALSRGRLRARDLVSPCHGVRTAATAPDTLLERVHALAAVTDAVVSHLSAAVLWGFPLPLALPAAAVVHLTSQPGHRAVRRKNAGINVPMFDETGGWIQDPDMSYEQEKVALQYDGGHHAEPGQRRSDIFRDERARNAGWRVVVLTQWDLNPLAPGLEPTAVSRVRAALLERGWAPEPPRRPGGRPASIPRPPI